MDRSSSRHGARYANNRPRRRSKSISNLAMTPITHTTSACGFPPPARQGSSSLHSSSWPGTDATPATSVLTRGAVVEKQATYIPPQCQPDTSETGISKEAGKHEEQECTGAQSCSDGIGLAQSDFETDPAHAFWTWDIEVQNWFHKEESTGFILWAPLQLD